MRGKQAKKRKVTKDYKYNSEIVGKFIQKVMLGGKKSKAESMFYQALEAAAAQVKVDPLQFIEQVIENVRPALEVRARRVGGANYQIPMPVSPARQETLAVRWIVTAARENSGASFVELLKRELLAAYNGEGFAIKKKDDMERMAEANKAFAHFRW